jgi:hypothetical protein
VKRFLWGVEGVREAGKEVLDGLLGGVRERVGSLMVVECDEGKSVGSGERFGGVAWGMVLSKISERSNVENVRFASSAMNWSGRVLSCDGLLHTLLEVKLPMGSSLLLLRRSCW